jgi:hypothetical protein
VLAVSTRHRVARSPSSSDATTQKTSWSISIALAIVAAACFSLASSHASRAAGCSEVVAL